VHNNQEFDQTVFASEIAKLGFQRINTGDERVIFDNHRTDVSRESETCWRLNQLLDYLSDYKVPEKKSLIRNGMGIAGSLGGASMPFHNGSNRLSGLSLNVQSIFGGDKSNLRIMYRTEVLQTTFSDYSFDWNVPSKVIPQGLSSVVSSGTTHEELRENQIVSTIGFSCMRFFGSNQRASSKRTRSYFNLGVFMGAKYHTKGELNLGDGHYDIVGYSDLINGELQSIPSLGLVNGLTYLGQGGMFLTPSWWLNSGIEASLGLSKQGAPISLEFYYDYSRDVRLTQSELIGAYSNLPFGSALGAELIGLKKFGSTLWGVRINWLVP
jgi:hypothetical protein